VKGWAQVLDEILPEPGIDLTILKDPAALQDASIKAIWGAAKRLRASTNDLELVLDVLFAETLS
jgi:hypothetical protein